MKKETCKRFENNFGPIFEDVDCMLCNVNSLCGIQYRESLLNKKKSEACNPCKECSSLYRCKKYKSGRRCIGQYSLNHNYNECTSCDCQFNCIEISGEEISFRCIKDLVAARGGRQFDFVKGQIYTFRKVNNGLIYKYEILTVNQDNLKNYFVSTCKK